MYVSVSVVARLLSRRTVFVSGNVCVLVSVTSWLFWDRPTVSLLVHRSSYYHSMFRYHNDMVSIPNMYGERWYGEAH